MGPRLPLPSTEMMLPLLVPQLGLEANRDLLRDTIFRVGSQRDSGRDSGREGIADGMIVGEPNLPSKAGPRGSRDYFHPVL